MQEIKRSGALVLPFLIPSPTRHLLLGYSEVGQQSYSNLYSYSLFAYQQSPYCTHPRRHLFPSSPSLD